MTNRGRPVSNRNRFAENDAVLSLYPDNDTILSTGFIHARLVEKELVTRTDRPKTTKILNRLVKERFLEKIDRGRWKATVKPEEFKLFEYLTQLRETDKNYESSVGGNLWKQNDIYFLGIPDEIQEDKTALFFLNILAIRLSEIYQGIKSLSHRVIRNIDNPDIQPEMPTRLLRQIILEILPYYLGSRAGIDGDGLSHDDLCELYKGIITNIPEFVEVEDRGSFTCKDKISDVFSLVSKMLDQSFNSYYESSDYEVDQAYSNNPEFKHGDFAVVLTDPFYLIDEDAEHRRRIYEEIIELNQINYSDIEIADSILIYEEKNVLEVLDNYVHLEIGREKRNAIRRIYLKMAASQAIASIMGPVEEGFLPENELKKAVQYYRSKGISTKELVYYLPFCKTGMNFNNPHPHKYKLIYNAFPTVPRTKLNKWYQEGVQAANPILEKKIERLYNSFNPEKNNNPG
ncbi:MAG: hypothetical protein ACTSW1_05815 [Candidatus Hodarchaeales archaeon]